MLYQYEKHQSNRLEDKSSEAFRTISEVSHEIGVPQHVLRFWEGKFSVISPVKRRGGRRYYRPRDIAVLRQIKELLYTEGYTIKGAQKLFSRGGIKTLMADSASKDKDSQNVKQETTLRPVATRGMQMDFFSAAAKPDMPEQQRDELRMLMSELSELRTMLEPYGF